MTEPIEKNWTKYLGWIGAVVGGVIASINFNAMFTGGGFDHALVGGHQAGLGAVKGYLVGAIIAWIINNRKAK